MRKSSKRSREVQVTDTGSEGETNSEDEILNVENVDDDGHENDSDSDGDDADDGESIDDEEEEQEEDGGKQNDTRQDAEMEELEKELTDLRHKEQDLLSNLKLHKDEDVLKGQAVKNQKALWDKTLEFRFLLQKSFSCSNRLPQEPLRSSFCDSDNSVKEAYSDLITSSKKTLESLLVLQEALLEKNPSITPAVDASRSSQVDGDEEWLQLFQMQSRIAHFRDKSVDKWQRKTQVTTGAAAIKGKLQAFNQNISEQVAAYMRDPSRMIKGMQQSRLAVSIFGAVPEAVVSTKEEDAQADGDPEILDDSEFYQQLLKEFFETFDPTSSDTAFYAMRRLQTKKRKIVDRRASKSRKIRYNVHEKMVNFMAPQPMDLPPMAPKLFENLFGLKTQKTTVA